jgi:single-strand DNA-binding protein
VLKLDEDVLKKKTQLRRFDSRASSVATQHSWKNLKKARESRTGWRLGISPGKLAKFAGTLKKGAHVQVKGKLCGRECEKDETAR